MENKELYHHGILGMKWGVRRTPAQLGHTPSSNGSKVSSSVNKKSRTSFFKKKRRSSKGDDSDDIETKKQKILKSRSPRELYKNADLFTTQELQSAYNRLQLERNIASLSPKEISKGEQYVNNAINFGRKANDLTDVGTKMYNNVAKVYNAFSANGKDKPLPIIGENQKKNKNNNNNNGGGN